MKLNKALKVLAVCLLMLQAPFAFAEETPAPQFFSALHDVPLMPGLRELSELTVVFDKPEGRIIESAASLEQVAPARAEAFYAQTLPQLGWQVQEKNVYARQGEVLQLAFEEAGGQGLLRVMVRPAR